MASAICSFLKSWCPMDSAVFALYPAPPERRLNVRFCHVLGRFDSAGNLNIPQQPIALLLGRLDRRSNLNIH